MSLLCPFSTHFSLHAHPKCSYCKHQALFTWDFSGFWCSLSSLLGQARSVRELKSLEAVLNQWLTEIDAYILGRTTLKHSLGCLQRVWVLIPTVVIYSLMYLKIFHPFSIPCWCFPDCFSNKLIALKCLSVGLLLGVVNENSDQLDIRINTGIENGYKIFTMYD